MHTLFSLARIAALCTHGMCLRMEPLSPSHYAHYLVDKCCNPGLSLLSPLPDAKSCMCILFSAQRTRPGCAETSSCTYTATQALLPGVQNLEIASPCSHILIPPSMYRAAEIRSDAHQSAGMQRLVGELFLFMDLCGVLLAKLHF